MPLRRALPVGDRISLMLFVAEVAGEQKLQYGTVPHFYG